METITENFTMQKSMYDREHSHSENIYITVSASMAQGTLLKGKDPEY